MRFHTARVKSVISSVRPPRPLFTQLQTLRCVALGDATGQGQTLDTHRGHVGMLCRQEALRSIQRWNVADDKEFPSGAFLEALPKCRGAFDALPVSRLTGVCSGQKQ
jgi:hypothetical protein